MDMSHHRPSPQDPLGPAVLSLATGTKCLGASHLAPQKRPRPRRPRRGRRSPCAPPPPLRRDRGRQPVELAGPVWCRWALKAEGRASAASLHYPAPLWGHAGAAIALRGSKGAAG